MYNNRCQKSLNCKTFYYSLPTELLTKVKKYSFEAAWNNRSKKSGRMFDKMLIDYWIDFSKECLMIWKDSELA